MGHRTRLGHVRILTVRHDMAGSGSNGGVEGRRMGLGWRLGRAPVWR